MEQQCKQVLQHDAAAVVLRAAGDAITLEALARYATCLAEYVEQAKVASVSNKAAKEHEGLRLRRRSCWMIWAFGV